MSFIATSIDITSRLPKDPMPSRRVQTLLLSLVLLPMLLLAEQKLAAVDSMSGT